MILRLKRIHSAVCDESGMTGEWERNETESQAYFLCVFFVRSGFWFWFLSRFIFAWTLYIFTYSARFVHKIEMRFFLLAVLSSLICFISFANSRECSHHHPDYYFIIFNRTAHANALEKMAVVSCKVSWNEQTNCHPSPYFVYSKSVLSLRICIMQKHTIYIQAIVQTYTCSLVRARASWTHWFHSQVSVKNIFHFIATQIKLGASSVICTFIWFRLCIYTIFWKVAIYRLNRSTHSCEQYGDAFVVIFELTKINETAMTREIIIMEQRWISR